MHAELGARGPGDRAGDLDLEARVGRNLAGKRQVRRIGAEPEPSNLAVAARGRHQNDGDREPHDSHSLSPNTTTTSLKFVLRAALHLGSFPNHTWDLSVPPAATAMYCFPSTA